MKHTLRCATIVMLLQLFVLTLRPATAHLVFIYGAGGAPVPLRGAAQVRLIDQEIKIVLRQNRVEVISTLRNEGAATTAVVGLPESGTTGDTLAFPRNGFMRERRAWADGRPISLQRTLPRDTFDAQDRFDDEYAMYWTHLLRFNRGQTRVLKYQLTSGRATMHIGDPQSGAYDMFKFALADTKRWKGTIGHIRIIFDAGGLQDFQQVEIDAPHNQRLHRSGERWIWESKRYVPQPEQELTATWWPGVRAIEVNGEGPDIRCVVVNPRSVQGSYDAVYTQQRAGHIWVPLRLLLAWLPAPAEDQENRIMRAAIETYFSLQKGEREVLVVVGSRDLEASEHSKLLGRYQMSEPAYLEMGAVMVELAPTVRALGGQVILKNGVVQVNWS